MAEDLIVVRGADFEVEATNRGKRVLTLSIAGKARLRLNQMICGKFAPAATMGEKMRYHRSEDDLEAELELTSVIPFGCEYLISNRIVVADGLLDITGSIRALNSGVIGDLDIGAIEFLDRIESVQITPTGSEKRQIFSGDFSGELYRGDAPPLNIQVVFADGVRCEYCTGFDVWRHCAAAKIPGAEAEFAISGNRTSLTFDRKVFIYGEEAEITEKRPWKFNTLFSWITPDLPEAADPDVVPQTIDGCPLSGVFRREFRRRLRKSEGDFLLSADVGKICDDASHLERKNQQSVRHYDPAEYLADYLWANHLLDRRGNSFAIVPDNGEKRYLLLAERFNRKLRKLE